MKKIPAIYIIQTTCHTMLLCCLKRYNLLTKFSPHEKLVFCSYFTIFDYEVTSIINMKYVKYRSYRTSSFHVIKRIGFPSNVEQLFAQGGLKSSNWLCLPHFVTQCSIKCNLNQFSFCCKCRQNSPKNCFVFSCWSS